MLNLMYITNRPDVAQIAEKSGVDRVFVDLEYLGKEKRQKGLDTVKSMHCEEDVLILSDALHKSELLVRINPINLDTKREIESVIQKGAQRLMLPMFKTPKEVELFLQLVDGRAATTLLLEHIDAVKCLDDILELKGIDEIHIGLNDLHLSMNLKFMFEIMASDMLEEITEKIKRKNIPFGIGGVGRIGTGTLLADMIIAEHYRLGSTAAILSRSFCNVAKCNNNIEIEQIFNMEVKKIRDYEDSLLKENASFFMDNKKAIQKKVYDIVQSIG